MIWYLSPPSSLRTWRIASHISPACRRLKICICTVCWFLMIVLAKCIDFWTRVSNYCWVIGLCFGKTLEEVNGTLWRSWLRHCTTSRKVTGSITDGVIGISHWHNPSGRTMALGLTQPLTEISTINPALYFPSNAQNVKKRRVVKTF